MLHCRRVWRDSIFGHSMPSQKFVRCNGSFRLFHIYEKFHLSFLLTNWKTVHFKQFKPRHRLRPSGPCRPSFGLVWSWSEFWSRSEVRKCLQGSRAAPLRGHLRVRGGQGQALGLPRSSFSGEGEKLGQTAPGQRFQFTHKITKWPRKAILTELRKIWVVSSQVAKVC